MTFILGIAGNLFANLAFWLLLGATFWTASRVVIRRFLSFFGLIHVDSIGVYLSNLWNPKASLTGRPVGYSISLHELRAAQSVEKLFGSASLRLPDLVRGLVDALWLRQRVQCTTDVSPVKAADANLDRNLTIIGSSMRNSVRARYVQDQLPRVILTGEDQGPTSWKAMNQAHSFTITRGEGKGEYPVDDVNLAVVEKCHDPERGTAIFFCLGVGTGVRPLEHRHDQLEGLPLPGPRVPVALQRDARAAPLAAIRTRDILFSSSRHSLR
jgi:hypothetical protein